MDPVSDLLDTVVVVVVGRPFLLLTPAEEEGFMFLFLYVALDTASLGENTIPDGGVDTTMLVSVLLVHAFFSLFFGGPLLPQCSSGQN